MRAKLLAAASAASLGLLAFTPAMAAPAAGGYIDAGYAGTSCSGCSNGNWNIWNVNGAAETPLGSSPVTLQGDGTYNSISIPHDGEAHFSQQNLSLIWNGGMGKVGATIGRDSFGFGSEAITGTTYGAFGVVYPTQQITLGLKGGTWQVGDGFPHIGYWGAEAKGYVQPNVSLGVTYDDGTFGNGSHNTIITWGGAAEWRPMAQPWSVKVGYQSARYFSNTTLNAWMINFRWHFGGGSTLVDHDRNGAEPWGTQQTAVTYID